MFPAQETPWTVLGLEAAAATQRDVKRAYAKLLKRFRPDTDPEGFRRIHEAYEKILAELDDREASCGEHNPIPPRTREVAPANDPPAPVPDLPEPFKAAVVTLRAARTSANLSAVPEALTQLRLVCGEDARLWLAWSATLPEIFDEGLAEAGIAKFIEHCDVLSELRAGGMAVAAQVLHYWHGEHNVSAMVATGKALTESSAVSEFDHPACGFFAMRLAFRLALAQPGGAGLLLDAAFAWLPARARSPLLPAIENRLNIGRLFWHLPADWQPIWENVLDELDASRAPDWDTPEARKAFANLIRATPADWPGWGFFESVLPPPRWRELVRTFHNRPVSGRVWTDPPAKTWIAPQPAPPSGDDIAFLPAVLPRGRSLPARSPDADLWEIDGPESAPATPATPNKAELPPMRPLAPRPSPSKEPRQPARRVQQPRSLKHRWRGLHPGAKFAIGCLATPVALALGLFIIAGIFTAVETTFRDKKTTPGPAAVFIVPDTAYFSRIEPILSRAPALKPELEDFLTAAGGRQAAVIENGGFLPTDSDEHRALLVCFILHPRVSMELKERSIDKIVGSCPPDAAVNLLKHAMIAGSPVAPVLAQSILKIYRERGDQLPAATRHELKQWDEQERQQKSLNGK